MQELLTPKEWIELFEKLDNSEHKALAEKVGIWVNGLDLLKHVLGADATNTLFKGAIAAPKQLVELDEDIQKHSKIRDNIFSEIEESSYYKVQAWDKFYSEMGDSIDIDKYIDRVPLCFSDRRKKQKDKSAISIIFDMGIPWIERDKDVVEKRHKYIYKIAFESDSENKPCRVIGACNMLIPECGYLKLFVVIKDYLDPIFPGLWGAFVSNRSTNSFLNCIMDYFVGTHEYGNGMPSYFVLDKYIPDEDLAIPFPFRCVTAKNIWSDKNQDLPDVVQP